MAEFQLEIIGLKETIAALNELPVRIVKNAYAKAFAAGCVPIIEAIQARAADFIDATGELEAHLQTDIRINSEGKGGKAEIGFGDKFNHIARFVEYGHHMIGRAPKKTDRGKVVQPHPFIRPAVATSAQAAIDAFGESIRQSVDEGLK